MVTLSIFGIMFIDINVRGDSFWVKKLFILWQEQMAVVRLHLL